MNFKFIFCLILIFSTQATFGRENPDVKKIDDPENHKLVLILNELVKKIDPLIANT